MLAEAEVYVEVAWQSKSGRSAYAEGRMVGLAPELWEGAPYCDYDNSRGSERYYFHSRDAANAFKEKVETYYEQNPDALYFVIDSWGNKVHNRHGQPVVAWFPVLTVKEANREED